MESEPEFSAEDLAYIRTEYRTAAELCSGRAETPDWLRRAIESGRLPRPSYVLPGALEMFPPDFFVLLDHADDVDELPFYFCSRYAMAAQSLGLDAADADDAWSAYLTGLFGVCLHSVTPESIAKKGQLINLIEHLMSEPAPGDHAWRTALRSSVDALDDLERPFTNYDRRRYGELSRDRYVFTTRKKYPQAFPSRR